MRAIVYAVILETGKTSGHRVMRTTHDKVRITTWRWQVSYKLHMCMLDASSWQRERSPRTSCVSVRLNPLARKERADPVPHAEVDMGPDETNGRKSTRRPSARLAEAVEGAEQSLPERLRHECRGKSVESSNTQMTPCCGKSRLFVTREALAERSTLCSMSFL